MIFLQDDSAKKEYVPDSPDISAIATEGEESPAKKESVLDVKKEEDASAALVSEAQKATESADDAGKRDYGWGGGGNGYGGYGGGHHGGGGGYGGHGGHHGHGEHGEHGHHEHGHDHHDHG